VVRKRAEDPLPLAGFRELTLSPFNPVGPQALQDLVAAQSAHVGDPVGIAPPHEFPAAKAAFDPDRDLGVRPGLAKPPDQQLQERATVLVGVAFARAEVGCHQFVAREYIQGQAAIVVVIGVAEPSVVSAMQGIVGGIDVEDQALRRMSVRSNERIDENLGDPHQGLALDAVLQPAKGSGGASDHDRVE
jgi:hypothetical protein